MVESMSYFTFSKLRYEKYLTLDVMMHVEHHQVLQFMFACNKQARTFLQHNYITVRNEFVNNGLIPYCFDGESDKQFYHYEQIEKLYFQALTRKIKNRVLTISVKIDRNNFSNFIEVVKWIKAQEQQIKLQFKVEVVDSVTIDHE
jgi:hypothetical protein